MTLTLDVLRETYCICRMDAVEAPDWTRLAHEQPVEFLSIARTLDELSIVCPAHLAPAGLATRSDGWRGLKVRGPLDLSLTGVMSRLVQCLADVPVFTVATYDTDYLLVPERDLARALAALRAGGHVVHD